MRRKIVELYYKPIILCPLCEHLESDEKKMIEHLINKHDDKEARELLGWGE